MRTFSSWMEQQAEANLELDREQFFFRVNFLHHQVYQSHQNSAGETNNQKQPEMNSDGSAFNRLMFLIVTEHSLRSAARQELLHILDYALSTDRCGLPMALPSSTSPAKCVLLPVLSAAARAELASRVPAWALENMCCSLCVGPGPEAAQNTSPENVRYYIRVSPLVKYIILARIGIVASVALERGTSRALEEQYDCVTTSSLLLLQVKALANGLRMFADRDGEWAPVLERFVSVVGDVLFSALDLVLCSRGGWTSEILLTSLYTLYTDWADRLPRDWVSRMKSVTERASAFHGSRPSGSLYSNQTWNWFGECTDENWSERVRWLAAVCEQQTDRRLVRVCVREEFAFIAEHIPYILFCIVPPELLSLLRRALHVARATGDRRMLDEALRLVRDILLITNTTLQRGLERTLRRDAESTWAGKNFSELFEISMPYFHKWCGFELGFHYGRVEYRPLPGIADSYGSLLAFLRDDAAPFLTELELGNLSSEVEYYVTCFNSKVSDIEGPLTLRFLIDMKKRRKLQLLNTRPGTNALDYVSAESDSYSGRSSDIESETELQESEGGPSCIANGQAQARVVLVGVSNLDEVADLIDKHLLKSADARCNGKRDTSTLNRPQADIQTSTCGPTHLDNNKRGITDSESSEPIMKSATLIKSNRLEDIGMSSSPDSKSDFERFRQEPEFPISSEFSD